MKITFLEAKEIILKGRTVDAENLSIKTMNKILLDKEITEATQCKK